MIVYFVMQPFFGTKFALIFAISSVIIDIDHWFWAIHKAKKLWLHEAYLWTLKEIKRMSAYEARGKKFKPVLHVFHTAEIITIVLVAGLFLPAVLPVALGLIFHVVCDLIEMFLTKTLHRRKWFLLKKNCNQVECSQR
ncbi:MAG: hypothetical protein QXR48_02775 [Candidatus Woesearchaeota archaeon]